MLVQPQKKYIGPIDIRRNEKDIEIGFHRCNYCDEIFPLEELKVPDTTRATLSFIPNKTRSPIPLLSYQEILLCGGCKSIYELWKDTKGLGWVEKSRYRMQGIRFSKRLFAKNVSSRYNKKEA